MKFELAKFKAGLNKCIGIVKDKYNLEELKSFYLKPDMENGQVYLAGSDGRINLLDKIDCEFEDEDKDEVLILSSSKLYQIAKCATDSDIYIRGGKILAIIISGTKKWTVGKIQENDYVNVPFKCFDIEKFDDELDAEEFLFVIERLVSNIHNPTEANDEFKQVYIDGEKIYSSTPAFATIAEFKTNGKYILEEKVVKSLINLLKGYTGKVFLTYDEADTEKVTVVIRTSTAVFVFKNKCYDYLDYIEKANALLLENAIVLDKHELANLINSARITSGNNHVIIDISVGKEVGKNNSICGDFYVCSKKTIVENFAGYIPILKSKRTAEAAKDKDKENLELIEPYRFTISLEDFSSAVNIIKSKFIILRYSNLGYDYLSISDDKNSYRSIIAIDNNFYKY